jgi:hypothetical protein
MIHALIALGFIAVIAGPCIVASKVDLSAEDANVPSESDRPDSIFR